MSFRIHLITATFSKSVNAILTSPIARTIDSYRAVQNQKQNVIDYQNGKVSTQTFFTRAIGFIIIPKAASAIGKTPIKTFLLSRTTMRMFKEYTEENCLIKKRNVYYLKTDQLNIPSCPKKLSFLGETAANYTLVSAQKDAKHTTKLEPTFEEAKNLAIPHLI